MQPLTISLLQTATHWHDATANRQMFTDLLTDLPVEKDLVLLPEMFSTGFTMASQEVAETLQGATAEWMASQARLHDCTLAGSVVIEDQGEYYNRFIAAQPAGEMHLYDKRHLFHMAGEHEYTVLAKCARSSNWVHGAFVRWFVTT